MTHDWNQNERPAHPWTNPTGTLVIGAHADRDEWLAARQNMICGSDIAALLGHSKYGDPFTVWADKTGQAAPEPANNAMRRGQLFEDAIVSLWAERYATFPIETRRQGLVRYKPWQHAGATVDRLSICKYDGKPHRCIIEVKSQADMREWFGPDGEDEVPLPFQFQGLWQLLVTGREHVHYVPLGPRFVPEHRLIQRDETLMATMLEMAREFWTYHVEGGIAPQPTDKAADTVRGMYRGLGGIAYVTPEVEPHVHIIREAKLVEAEAKRNATASQAALQAHMGEATELRWPDETVAATWTPSPKQIDGANADWRKANPELVEQYTVPGPDVIDVAKLVENHPEVIESRSLRYRRTFNLK